MVPSQLCLLLLPTDVELCTGSNLYFSFSSLAWRTWHPWFWKMKNYFEKCFPQFHMRSDTEKSATFLDFVDIWLWLFPHRCCQGLARGRLLGLCNFKLILKECSLRPSHVKRHELTFVVNWHYIHKNWLDMTFTLHDGVLSSIRRSGDLCFWAIG